jgi:hypothetical protein
MKGNGIQTMRFARRLSYWFVVLVLLPGLATAGLRCGTQLAREGDTKAEVRAKCGSPVTSEFVGVKEVRGNFVNVEQWTYQPGAGKFLQVLEFHGGELVSIRNGGRI